MTTAIPQLSVGVQVTQPMPTSIGWNCRAIVFTVGSECMNDRTSERQLDCDKPVNAIVVKAYSFLKES